MSNDWDIIITNKNRLFSIDLSEVWRYRDLLSMYVKRDIITFYKQTILGPLWFVIQPLFTTIMFMFVFGGIAGISTDGIPQAVFYLAGLVCWNYFQDCLSKCSDTFNANQAIFGKVYFPRLVVPLSIVISNLIKMAIQFALFLVVYIYYFASGIDFQVNAALLLIPLLIIMLGTNDCNEELGLSAEDIAAGMETLVSLAEKESPGLQGYVPQMIVAAPVPIGEDYEASPFAGELDPGSVRKSQALAPLYEKIADRHDCLFADAGARAEVSSYDCEHLTEKGHRQLAELLFEVINGAFNGA